MTARDLDVVGAVSPAPCGPLPDPDAVSTAVYDALQYLVPWTVDQCRRQGIARVALYGAGAHTRLLAPLWRAAGGPEIVAVIEGQVAASECAGLPIASVRYFDIRRIDAIVLSSQTYETEMAQACASHWPSVPVYRIWRPALEVTGSSLSTVPPQTETHTRPLDPYDAYVDFCRTVFETTMPPGNSWLLWSFARDSPQTVRLWEHMDTIKLDLFREYILTLTAEGREGGVVEFGVASGRGLAALADGVERSGALREVVGYDSFMGLPEPSPDYDLDCWHAGDYRATLSDVGVAVDVERRPWLRLVPGWFSTTLAASAAPSPARVALAHIDCDLYESACSSLAFLDNRLVDGAFLCFDDWTHNVNLGETRAFVEFHRRVEARYRFEHIASLGSGACHFRVWLKS